MVFQCLPVFLRAFFFGSLLTLAQAPVNFWPAPFFAFPLFLALIYRPDCVIAGRREVWRAAWLGWWFAFGNFVTGLYWIAASMLVDFHRFWWAIPFSVAGLPAYLALYPAFATACWQRMRQRLSLPPAGSILLFAILWSIGEWLRGHVATGFPWLMPAYGWEGLPAFQQSLSLCGAYGVSLLTVALGCQPWLVRRAMRKTEIVSCVAAMVLFSAATGWGMARLREAPLDENYQPDLRIRIVQADIPESMKIDYSQHVAIVEKLLNLSMAPALSDAMPPPNAIIWPEASVAFYPQFDDELRHRLAAIVPPVKDGILLFGAPARENEGIKGYSYYNSLFAVDAQSELVGRYDKAHLVPFGEFFPFRAALLDIGLSVNNLAAGKLDFSSGPGAQLMAVPGLPPFSPLICYEAIFPGAVKPAKSRPAWLLNVTNDAWFGNTSGPYQHLSIARARAIEEGVPLIRAANTGISAIIDPYGRTLASLKLGMVGVLDGSLPKPLKYQTYFSRYGNFTYLFLLIGCVILTGISAATRSRAAATPNL